MSSRRKTQIPNPDVEILTIAGISYKNSVKALVSWWAQSSEELHNA
jgi:hypothetical protein